MLWFLDSTATLSQLSSQKKNKLYQAVLQPPKDSVHDPLPSQHVHCFFYWAQRQVIVVRAWEDFPRCSVSIYWTVEPELEMHDLLILEAVSGHFGLRSSATSQIHKKPAGSGDVGV